MFKIHLQIQIHNCIIIPIHAISKQSVSVILVAELFYHFKSSHNKFIGLIGQNT